MDKLVTVLNSLNYPKDDVLALIHMLVDNEEVELDELKNQTTTLSEGNIIKALLALELTGQGQILLYIFHDCSTEPQVFIPNSTMYVIGQTFLCDHCGKIIDIRHTDCELRFKLNKELL